MAYRLRVLGVGLVCQFVALAGPAVACSLAPIQAGTPMLAVRPVDDAELSTRFGVARHPILNIDRFHTGVDWIAPMGTRVMAAATGRVVLAGRAEQLGNRVVIDHGHGWKTLYAHLSGLAVVANDCVVADTVIGFVGMTGLAAWPHLHFEVWQNETPVDPLASDRGLSR